MNSPSQIDCFGLEIRGLASDDVIREIENRKPNNPCWIVTANPEILLHAKRDRVYAQTLRNADIRIVDGLGLKLLGLLRGKKLVRTTGVDLSEALIAWTHETGQTVGFIGGLLPNTAARAYAKMAQKYPGLKGVTEYGGIVSTDGEGDASNEEARRRLTLQAPDILLVAFGHPKQERWIERYIREFPTLKAVIGVGGTFDYWSGAVTRAPKWMRSIGLEWLYRLIKEPKRWRRIWNAVVVFPWYVFKESIFNMPGRIKIQYLLILCLDSIFIFGIYWYIKNNFGKINLIIADLLYVFVVGVLVALISYAFNNIKAKDQNVTGLFKKFLSLKNIPSFLLLLLCLIIVSLIITYLTKFETVPLKDELAATIVYDIDSNRLLNKEELNGFNTEIIRTFKYFDDNFDKKSLEAADPAELYNVLVQFSILKKMASQFSRSWSCTYTELETAFSKIGGCESTHSTSSTSYYYDLKLFDQPNYKHYFDYSSEPRYIFMPLGVEMITLYFRDSKPFDKSIIEFKKDGWFNINIEISTFIPGILKYNDGSKSDVNMGVVDYIIRYRADFNRFKMGSTEMEKYINLAERIKELLHEFNTKEYLNTIKEEENNQILEKINTFLESNSPTWQNNSYVE